MRLPNDIIVHYEELADGTGIEGHYAGELIRCKYCRYYDADAFQCETDKPHSGTWMPESYCDRAERKEE